MSGSAGTTKSESAATIVASSPASSDAEHGSASQTYGAAKISTVEVSCPIPETHNAYIEECLSNTLVYVLPQGANQEEARQVEVVRKHCPMQAYMALQDHPRRLLNTQVPGWGEEYLGVVLHRLNERQFAVAPSQDLETVVIKRFSKAVVHSALARGFLGENPYIDILRMQAIGDNTHVISCIEALEDETCLYIITPYIEHDLGSWIRTKQGVSEIFAKDMIINMLQNILYLQGRGICHRNLTPENCKVSKVRVIFTGLGHSFRAPQTDGLIRNTGAVGDPAFMPPEVYVGLPFDARAYDLWSTAVILFNLLTGSVLCERPTPDDMLFRYLVLARGLSHIPDNALTRELLSELDDDMQSMLLGLSKKCVALSPEILEFLEGCIFVAPDERWTVRDAEACLWLKGSGI